LTFSSNCSSSGHRFHDGQLIARFMGQRRTGQRIELLLAASTICTCLQPIT
jgi:uncharacterized Zn finger protein